MIIIGVLLSNEYFVPWLHSQIHPSLATPLFKNTKMATMQNMWFEAS